MVRLIYEMFKLIFGGGMPTMVSKFVSKLLSAAQTVMLNNSVITAMNIFLSFGASLMIFWFFVNITQQASKDMLTLERLIQCFIKLFVAFCIMLYIPEISNGLFSMGIALYEKAVDIDTTADSSGGTTGESSNNAEEDDSGGITYFGYAPGKLPDWDDKGEDGQKIRDIFTAKGSSGRGAQSNYVDIPGTTQPEETEEGLFPDGHPIKTTLSAVGTIITLLIPAGACLLAAGLSFLTCITQIISFFVYVILSPIAVSQAFEEGHHNGALRYMKKMAALILTFTVIAVILWAVNLLQSGLLINLIDPAFFTNGTHNVGKDNFFRVVSVSNFSFMLTTAVLQCSAAGAIMKAPQIANDVLNVH